MFKLKIPPPIYMVLTAGLMWLVDRFLPIIEVAFYAWNQFGIIFIVAAVIIDAMSLLQFFRSHTTINPLHPENTEKLVTMGMYQYSRNPMYVGLLLLLTGWAFLLRSFSPFILLPIFMVMMTRQQIIPEEKILELHKLKN